MPKKTQSKIALIMGILSLLILVVVTGSFMATRETAYQLTDKEQAKVWVSQFCTGTSALGGGVGGEPVDYAPIKCVGGSSSSDCVEDGSVTVDSETTLRTSQGGYYYLCSAGVEKVRCGATNTMRHTIIDGIESEKLSSVGSHLVVRCDSYDVQMYPNACGTVCQPFWTFQRINVRPLPCVVDENQIIVFEAFGQGKVIQKDSLHIAPVKFCSGLSPIVNDDTKKIYYQDCLTGNPDLCDNILGILKNNQAYTVPDDRTVGVWYVAEKPNYITAVCKEGENYLVKEGYCADTSGILLTCTNGIIQPDGSCFTQPAITEVCDGIVKTLSNGTRICEIVLPTREIFKCEDGREVLNQEECTVVIEQKLKCGDGFVTKVEDCFERVELKTDYECPDGKEPEYDKDKKDYICVADASVYTPVTKTSLSSGKFLWYFVPIMIVIAIGSFTAYYFIKRRKR